MDKPTSGVKGVKTQITYTFTADADGSEKLPLIIIGQWVQPRAFQGKSSKALEFYYRNNAKAWMTGKLYQEWISSWDRELQKKKQWILLLQDNFSAHIVPYDLSNHFRQPLQVN